MKADHKKVARQIKIARGQLDGILKMIEEDRVAKSCVPEPIFLNLLEAKPCT